MISSHHPRIIMQTANVRAPASVYAPPASRELEPVAPSERIQALDLLRGWAMFGVLWSNLNDWYGTTDEATRFDRILSFSQEWLVESRFYTLLCFLFGIGFGIQLMRAAERGSSVQRTYVRRSAALLAIGLIHGLLIWRGDILTLYALVSFSLLLFRDATPRQLVAWMAGIALFSAEVIARFRWIVGQRYMVAREPATTANWIYGHGSYAQIAHQRVYDFADWWGRWGLPTYFSVLAMFLAGVWAIRSGFARRVFTDPATTRRFLAICVVVSLVGYAIDVFGGKFFFPPQSVEPTTTTVMLSWRRFVWHALDWSVEASGLAYAALLLLIFQTARGARLLAPLAATGRMALTTYLTQSVVCTTLFYSYGFRLLGRVGYTGMFTITVTLFAVQMAVSVWWLKRYRFGPVEWLWRTLTYGRAPAMRVAPEASPA
ncbi:MAG TPA: DUF418 domain-containing protein [Gemmatimonadaceae bacterium]